MATESKFNQDDVIEIDHGAFLSQSHRISSRPAGSVVVADHGGLFGAYYSLGAGRYTAGATSDTAEAAYESALSGWAGARYQQDPAKFKQIPRAEYLAEQAAPYKGVAAGAAVGDVVSFSRFAFNSKSGRLTSSHTAEKMPPENTRGRVVGVDEGVFLVEPYDHELGQYLERHAKDRLATVDFGDAVLANPLNSATHARLSKYAAPIFENVLRAMREAEEMGGPEGRDYRKLMEAIRNEASQRLANFKEVSPRSFVDGPAP